MIKTRQSTMATYQADTMVSTKTRATTNTDKYKTQKTKKSPKIQHHQTKELRDFYWA
jgi:hypothetical protein